MEITYKIDKEKKLIIETWPEKPTLEDYTNAKLSEFSDPDFNPDFNVITDLRKVNVEFNETLIESIISFMKENPDNMRNRKSAIIADSPQLVASSLFFGQKTRNLSVKVSVFSSMHTALKWIKENWH